MRYFLFVLVMLGSVNGIRRLDWPGWAQVAVVLAVNLLVGALLWSGDDQDEPATPEGPQPR